MQIKQCRFILNTLNQVSEKNKLPVKPKIHTTIFLDNSAAEANPYTGEIYLNLLFNNRLFRPFIKKLIKHEAKHIEQYQIIARYFAGIAQNIDNGLNNFKELILKKFPMYKNDNFNDKFYKQTIAKDGVITKTHPLFKKAQEYIKAVEAYPTSSSKDEIDILTNDGIIAMFKNRFQKAKAYRKNLLEEEARRAEKEKL